MGHKGRGFASALLKSHCSSLKCHYDQILDIHFFTFSYQYIFPSYLAKFQSITNITAPDFWTFISEN